MHFDCSPKEYYLNIRLTHAQNLLKQSSMSVSNVALACGFANASSFNKAYKNQFNYSPKNERGIFGISLLICRILTIFLAILEKNNVSKILTMLDSYRHTT